MLQREHGDRPAASAARQGRWLRRDRQDGIDGDRPVHRTEIVALLLEHGANPEMRDALGKRAGVGRTNGRTGYANPRLEAAAATIRGAAEAGQAAWVRRFTKAEIR